MQQILRQTYQELLKAEHRPHFNFRKANRFALIYPGVELVHLLLEQTESIRGVVRAHKVARDAAQSARVCELDRMSKIVDLKRGRCHYCQIKKKKPQHYTSSVCRVCRV